MRNKVLAYCDKSDIETRPIISGNLLRQTCLKDYDDYINYPIRELLNNNGLYVGLYSKLKEKQVQQLVTNINNL